ncbi:hypothetical protein ABWL39_06345, partial [Chitinivorax sp. PXF-14]|uniref:hypothetical protein n=1 Tax=Chitinivorax sp. PXF-14 TaxID=3230488 RepID=UPI003466767B
PPCLCQFARKSRARGLRATYVKCHANLCQNARLSTPGRTKVQREAWMLFIRRLPAASSVFVMRQTIVAGAILSVILGLRHSDVRALMPGVKIILSCFVQNIFSSMI